MEYDFDNPDWMHDRIRKAFAGYDTRLTGEAAAKECTRRMMEVLCIAALDTGMKPSIEVHQWGPEDKSYRGSPYGVSWEAGPYQWAIGASFLIMDLTGRLVEPYYSFDLCFYEVE